MFMLKNDPVLQYQKIINYAQAYFWFQFAFPKTSSDHFGIGRLVGLCYIYFFYDAGALLQQLLEIVII